MEAVAQPPTTFRLTPRPYQHEAVAALLAAAARGVQRPLLVLPTGTGKTIIFALLVVIFQNKCDWVDETSKTYGRPRCRKNATESFHSATGLILSTFNATELNQNFIYLCN